MQFRLMYVRRARASMCEVNVSSVLRQSDRGNCSCNHHHNLAVCVWHVYEIGLIYKH